MITGKKRHITTTPPSWVVGVSSQDTHEVLDDGQSSMALWVSQ